MQDNDRLIRLESDLERINLELFENYTKEVGLETYAEAIANFESLDENKKVILAKEYMATDTSLTAKEREQMAYSSNVYVLYLETLKEAHKEKIKAMTKKEILLAKVNVYQTLISTERARMGLK